MATKTATKASARKKPIKKIAAKKSTGENPGGSSKAARPTEKNTPGAVSIRMYCIGTGDCFIIKFFDKNGKAFTMMIDCGSCMGDAKWFEPYLTNIASYVGNTIDLLVITHEHQDHVNGFQKSSSFFEKFKIKEAWLAWTENPEDPGGDAAELLMKKKTMKAALGNALVEIRKRDIDIKKEFQESAFQNELLAAQNAFVNGLDSIAAVNIDEGGEPRNELAGLKKIKEILKNKKVKTRYLNPGTTVTVEGLKDIKFHVLGPPRGREFIFKDGKQGTDVFKKNMALNESTLAARAFNNLLTPNIEGEDLPFKEEYIANVQTNPTSLDIMNKYNSLTESWRKVDNEWLLSAGSLALRLNSHINNTSLALAIESEETGKVLLFPGDAEYGSWESWHLIKTWDKKSRDGKKHLVEDLLNRTIFYKVGHHLSYNGTALEQGINMMPDSNLVAMATLDRNRISKGWKSTMPNKLLLKELIRKTAGRFFIMDETEVENAPSKTLDPETIGETKYKSEKRPDGAATLYKQYTVEFTK